LCVTAASEAESWVYAKHITTTHSEFEEQGVRWSLHNDLS